MSCSRRAWTENGGFVSAPLRGADRLETHEVQSHLGYKRFARAVSSLAQLSWVTTAVMFVLAINSAAAPGQAGIPYNGTSVAPATGGASQSRGITPSATPNADPQHARGAAADGRPSEQDVLAIGSGYSKNKGSAMVKALQRRLIGLGYSPGPVDGRYGPLTEGAVIRFQAAHGLKVDGIAGPLTLGALASAKPVLYPDEGYAPGGSATVRRLQRQLAATGYAPGRIDGRYGPLTERAVRRFQAAHHLQIDGFAGPQTARHLETAQRARIHHQRRPVQPAPVTSHHPSRPVPPPAGRTRGHTRSVPPRSHRVSSSQRTFSTAWIVLAACLIAVALTAMLWRRPRRRGERMPAMEPPPAGGGPQVVDVAQAAGRREDRPNLTVRSIAPPEQSAKLPADEAAGDYEDEQVGAAVFRRGLQLARDGDLVGAEAAFRQSDGHGNGGAACNLGVLLERRGDLGAARQAYQRAAERGEPSGAYNLGALLEDQGDLLGAWEAYRRSDERGNPDGAYRLGVLLEQEGDCVGAKDAYRRADQRGNPAGACGLGLLLLQEGDRAGALEALQRAGGRGSGEVADAANAAMLDLGGTEGER